MSLEGWSVFGTAVYTRLQGDFADSPLVADRGNASQFFFASEHPGGDSLQEFGSLVRRHLTHDTGTCDKCIDR